MDWHDAPVSRFVEWVEGLEAAVENRIARTLRGRPGWQVIVEPYAAHGTRTWFHVRGRVLLRRHAAYRYGGVLGPARTAMARYGSLDLAGVPVQVSVAGRTHRVTSSDEGYLEAVVDLPDLPPGWHTVTYRPDGGDQVDGPLLVVDPTARLGIVSDLDDTVIHTGLTRPLLALRNTFLVSDAERRAVAGGAELYQGLVAGAGSQTPVFYVSTGAWNLHAMLVAFLRRTGFPRGPLVLTDWGPSRRWLFREDSAAFKARTIRGLMAEHPHLSWVLIGDSGQHDAQAYAEVAGAEPDRVRVVYLRDVPPASVVRTAHVEQLVEEIGALSVPMLLVRDYLAAAEHAHRLGLVDAETLERVRAAVRA